MCNKSKIKNINNNIKIVTIDSNIRVIMEKIDYVKSASFGIWVKAGSVDEEKFNSGVSHFIEHMMFKGTETRSAKDIATDIDKIGGQINAFTGKEATCYYVKTVKDNILKGAEVILDMLNNSVFDAKEMTKERMVILEEMKMTEDQPDDLVHEKSMELIFKGEPLGRSIIGTTTSLKNTSRKVLVDYRDKEYTKDSIVVSVAGSFDEDELIDFLSGKFKNFKDSKGAKKNSDSIYIPSGKVITKEIQQSHICLAAKTIALDHKDYYVLSILSSVLGGSMSSRLFQNIREQKGLAYSVFSMTSSFSSTGYFSIYAGVSHDKIEKAIQGIQEELNILDREGISFEELNMAKEQMKSSFVFGQENVASIMFRNGKNLTLLNKIQTADEIMEAIDKVSLEDIDRIKNMICDTSKYSIAAVTDKRFDWRKVWSS